MILDVFHSTSENFGDQKSEIHSRHISISKNKVAPAMGDQKFEIHDFGRVLFYK